MQTGAINLRKRFTQLQHKGFLCLMHGKKALSANDQEHKNNKRQH